MRAAFLASMLALAAPAADAGGPNTFQFLALEPPPVHLAGGYEIALEPVEGERGALFDQSLRLHLQDPWRGAPANRRAGAVPRGPGPGWFAVRDGPGLLASSGALAAAPATKALVVHLALEDAEYWEAWRIDPAPESGGGWSFCLSRDATLRGRLRVLDGVTGRPVDEGPISYVESSTDCGGSRDEALQRVPAEDSLAEFALEGLAETIADRVAPRWVPVEARLVRKGGAGRGHRLIRSGDLGAATRWYLDAARKDPEDPWLHYHAALLLTAGLHFALAREHLAAARAASDELLFAEWEDELHRRERAALMLRRMGVPQEPLRF